MGQSYNVFFTLLNKTNAYPHRQIRSYQDHSNRLPLTCLHRVTRPSKRALCVPSLTQQSVRDALRLSDSHLRQIEKMAGAIRCATGPERLPTTLREAKRRLLRGLLADPDAHLSVESTTTEALEQTFHRPINRMPQRPKHNPIRTRPS